MAAARAINASPAVVALYGPILDVHSLGELAMTKLTVLYAVFVALMFAGRWSAGTPAARRSPGTPSCSAAPRRPRRLLAAAVLVGGVGVACCVGLLAAVADVAGGLPVAGSLAVRGLLGRDRAGRGRR